MIYTYKFKLMRNGRPVGEACQVVSEHGYAVAHTTAMAIIPGFNRNTDSVTLVWTDDPVGSVAV